MHIRDREVGTGHDSVQVTRPFRRDGENGARESACLFKGVHAKSMNWPINDCREFSESEERYAEILVWGARRDAFLDNLQERS
jgi:hypothetical protein